MKPHILVVDDSLTIRMDLRGALVAAGFDVTLCETKRTAIAMLEQRAFNAVVLDVVLPDGDGVELLQLIRTSAEHSEMPVVMLSSEAEVADRVRGLTMGADEYVGKPYNIAYFIRCLRALVRRGRHSTPPPVSIVGCRRILAVDDSPTFLAHIGRMLREDGHDVVFARSGREALDMLAAQTIDCIIVDLVMPDVDGLETIRQIRQTPGRESTPTIMLTASENPADQRNATAAGADDFAIKAIALEAVRAKVHNLLRRKHRNSPTAKVTTPPPAPVAARRSVFPTRNNDAPPSKRIGQSLPPARIEKKTFCPLFLEIASTMGLNADRARDSLARTLGRLNIDVSDMNLADLSRALPTLRDTLAMFFAAEEVTPRAYALAAIVAAGREVAA